MKRHPCYTCNFFQGKDLDYELGDWLYCEKDPSRTEIHERTKKCFFFYPDLDKTQFLGSDPDKESNR